jgi:hypothetical protein
MALPRRPARTTDQHHTVDPAPESARDPAQPARSTALFQLATEIPARTLGIHTDVAVAWQRLSAGDWANYAAEVSRRTKGP